MKLLTLMSAALMLQGCACIATQKQSPLTPVDKERLIQVTELQSAEQKGRYGYRHPVETLTFFGIKPGATVVEALPGEGWYSKILVPYIGHKGQLIGVDYNVDMWPHFGGFATPEFIAGRKLWPEQWVKDSAGWSQGDGAKASAYTFATLPDTLVGQVDAVLFIRALHNLARFEPAGGYLTQALAQTYRMLKPDGVVGIVQHVMAEDKPDAWATGDRGYLKRSFLMAAMEKAGFEFVAESTINQNLRDNPADGDVVWRLPPSLDTPEATKPAMQAIGESNRVTLLFRKKRA